MMGPGGTALLRIGEIPYANCLPIFHGLREIAPGRYTYVPGEPVRLNALLHRGEIDAGPCSSLEYGLHAADYLLVPGHSIAAEGEVLSVVLVSRLPLAALQGRTVALSPRSATSNALARIILERFHGLQCRYAVGEADGAAARVVIGDRALRTALRPGPGERVYDLGRLWRDATGLPAVFALWMVRRDPAAARPAEVAALVRDLGSAREYALARLERLAEGAAARVGVTPAELLAYWRKISFDLDRAKERGLARYFAECRELGLLRDLPEPAFARPGCRAAVRRREEDGS